MESYGHCDSHFRKNEYMAAFETEDCLVGNKDVTPIFATKDLDLVSYLNITNCTSSMYHLRGLFIGTIASPCPTLCNETLTNSALISRGKSDSGEVSIAFDRTVMIDKITVDRIQLMESLNFFGSNLGLWPGLAIFQVLEWLLENVVCKIKFTNIIRQAGAELGQAQVS